MKPASSFRLLGVAACLFAVAGCGETAVVNPTGSCGTRPDPGREGYSGGYGTWVPDCDPPLLREYWRVDTTDGQTAFTLPRMDGEPAFQAACAEGTHDLHALVARYDLCAPAETSNQVNAVNAMTIGDALRLTHFLHQHLTFSADGMTLTRYPFPSDVFDACALHPNSPELQGLCDQVRANLENPVGLSYTGQGAAELVARLNELYGIQTN